MDTVKVLSTNPLDSSIVDRCPSCDSTDLALMVRLRIGPGGMTN